MATEAKVLTGLTPNIKGSFARLNAQMVFVNGYEKPRYFDRTGRSGYLGLQSWATSTYTPTCAVSAGGSMTEGLYFSAQAVAVDTRYSDKLGNYRRSNPTLASTAVLTTAANKTLTITIPNAHPQLTLNDTPALEANEIWIYVSQGAANATLAQEGTKYYVGKLSTNAAGSLVITSDPSTANNALELDNYQPPTLSQTCALQDKLWGIVNATEMRGQVSWNAATARFEGKTYGAFTISGVTSQGQDIWRYAFSGSPDLSAITTSMRLTATGCSVAGNNVSLGVIVGVSNSSDYIDVRNENGSASGTFGTATVYTTFFADGFDGEASFRFEDDGVNQIYTMQAVSVSGQYFTAVEGSYNGLKTPSTYYNFYITTSDRLLWWSKLDDPNSWPTENTLQFEEDLTAIAPAGEYLLVFSRNTCYTVNPRSPEEGFRKTHAPTGTISPFSVVPAENGVYYFDGKTIRLFDGLQAPDITRRKVRILLESINESLQDRVHGVYLPNEQAIRWYIPYGASTPVNNYYAQYNMQTGFWWIGQCIDCTCASVMLDETTGVSKLYTGTSARYSKRGHLLEHGGVYTDGLNVATTTVFGTIASYTASTRSLIFTISTGAVSTSEYGTPFNIFAATGTRDIIGIIESIVNNGGGSYTIVHHADFDLSTVQVGDWIAIGLPQYRWGIKWLDFGTPQYKHELKEIHLSFTACTYGYGIMDFYTDFSETANKSVSFSVVTGENNIVIPYHGARGNQVGFKVRMWSQYLLEIRDMVVIHRSIV